MSENRTELTDQEFLPSRDTESLEIFLSSDKRGWGKVYLWKGNNVIRINYAKSSPFGLLIQAMLKMLDGYEER